MKNGRYRFSLAVRKKFFTMSVGRQRHGLLREVLDAPSLEMFRARLSGALNNLVQ